MLIQEQFDNLKFADANPAGLTLRMNTKMFDKDILSHKLMLTTRQKNDVATYTILSKTQTSKITQNGGFLSALLSKIAGPLINIAVLISKNILTPLGITAAALAVDVRIQNKIHDFGAATLIISNEEMNDVMNIFQVLQRYH